MADIKWIKITTDIFDDEKISVIEKMPEGDTLLVIWLKLLTLAGKKNDCGQVYFTQSIPYTVEMLSDIFKRDARLVSLALNTFTAFDMIYIEDDIISILNWEKHQNVEGMDKIREQAKLRMRKYRQHKALPECNVTVTQRDGIEVDKNRKDIKNKDTAEADEAFNQFYSLYPKKRGKPQAEKAFKKVYKSLPSITELSRIIDKWKKTEDWQKQGGQFIPYPASWLNAEGWNDDIPEPWTDPEIKARDTAAATKDVFWKVCPDCGYQVKTIGAMDQCPTCGEYGTAFKQGRGKEYPEDIV